MESGNLLLWFATCCSVGSQLCILGSSEITDLCPGACAACLLATFRVSGDLLVVRIVVIASSPRACSALLYNWCSDESSGHLFTCLLTI